MTELMTTEELVTKMFFPAKSEKACSHDFVAPEGKLEHAICAKCGSEPRHLDAAYTIRQVPVREWIDIALKCVKVG